MDYAGWCQRGVSRFQYHSQTFCHGVAGNRNELTLRTLAQSVPFDCPWPLLPLVDNPHE